MKVERCPVCKRRVRRSNEANAYMWALLHEMAERIKPGGVSYSADVWHLEMKRRFLGCDDVKLPSGKVVSVPKSSAELDADAFADYVTKIEQFAAERGVYLADREAA